MRSERGVRTDRHHIRVQGDTQGFEVALSARRLQDGLDLVAFKMTSHTPAAPPPLEIVFDQPVIDTHGRWYPAGRSNRAMYPEWDSRFTSQMTKYAPVVSFYSLTGRNRLTVACGDAIHPIEIAAGVHEETAGLKCQLRLFKKPHLPIDRYETTILIDTRDVPYHESLENVGRWWEAECAYTPFPVPESARVPLYSTWYSVHQSLVVDEVVEQCRLARELGCEAVIVDDGWQTTDTGRGYAYTGDWEPVRIGDMKHFVQRVHDLGMKFLLWYALPFVGLHSRAFKRFVGKTLRYSEGARAAALDPRYPEVRQYLADIFDSAMREWDVDGFKLDFLDWFNPSEAPSAGAGTDCELLTEGTHRLLSDIGQRLRRIKPDTLIEFRGPYTGPAMRQYANMFRSLDCPNDANSNRINTLDQRLLCGRTAVHSDMLMWNVRDSAESAALQLLNVLFSVPQISVLIDRLPPDHYDMLRFWLSFWREHRDVLLDGKLQPLHPESLFAVVIASTSSKRILAVYDAAVTDPGPQAPPEILVVNATRSGRVVLDISESLGTRHVQLFDCCGRKVREETQKLGRGLHALAIPPTGLGRLTAS